MDGRIVVGDQVEVDQEPSSIAVPATAAIEQNGTDARTVRGPGGICHGGNGGVRWRGQLRGDDCPQFRQVTHDLSLT